MDEIIVLIQSDCRQTFDTTDRPDQTRNRERQYKITCSTSDSIPSS